MRLNHNGGISAMMQVAILPNIGLDFNERQSIVEMLNSHLANEVVLTTKTRSAHWNVNGTNFYQLHTLFRRQYKQLNGISDEIAERVRMLGGFAIGSFQEFLLYARLDEQPGDVPEILHLLADHEAAIRFLREGARKCSEEYEDQGTFALLVSIIRRHEKMAWMLRSYAKTEQEPEKP